jgi:hypothetical protein
MHKKQYLIMNRALLKPAFMDADSVLTCMFEVDYEQSSVC